MPKAIKPDPEELEDKLDDTIDEAEKIKAKEEKDLKKKVKKVEEEPEDEEKDEEVEEKEEEKDEEEEEKEEEKEEKKPEKVPDYKEKFINSTKEAQVLHAKNKKIVEALKEAKEAPEPTEEELKAEYSDWDIMDDTQKKLAKQAMVSTRRFNALDSVTTEFSAIEEWQDKVEKFVADPENLNKHPELEGKIAEFKAFASKPTRRGLDFDDLISAFMWDESKQVKTHKGKVFPAGSGGPKDKPKSNKLSIEDARKLRETDYPKWVELLKAGKIESGV